MNRLMIILMCVCSVGTQVADVPCLITVARG